MQNPISKSVVLVDKAIGEFENHILNNRSLTHSLDVATLTHYLTLTCDGMQTQTLNQF